MTWRVLVEVLKDIELGELAREIEESTSKKIAVTNKEYS